MTTGTGAAYRLRLVHDAYVSKANAAIEHDEPDAHDKVVELVREYDLECAEPTTDSRRAG